MGNERKKGNEQKQRLKRLMLNLIVTNGVNELIVKFVFLRGSYRKIVDSTAGHIFKNFSSTSDIFSVLLEEQ